jgi:short-subunit dehydrogenase
MQDVDRAIDVNHAWRHPHDARGPTMVSSKGGAIVNVASVGGVIGVPGPVGLRGQHARRHRLDQERRA